MPKDLIDLHRVGLNLAHKGHGQNNKDYTELGYGSIDYSKVLQTQVFWIGILLFRAGNYKINSMDGAKKALLFLKKIFKN